MRLVLVSAVAVLALAGCKKEAEPAGPKSVEEAAAAAESLPAPQPGYYRTQVKLVSLDAPGMPKQMVEQMKGVMAKSVHDSEFCLTEEEAKKGYEERVKKLSGRDGCSFDKYDADGGNLDAQMSCTNEDGSKSVLGMNGSMTPTGSDMTMRMAQSGGQGPMGDMTMEMRVTSLRVGDCPKP